MNGITTASTYDDANQLTAAGTTTFTYDANGSRVTRTQGGATTAYSYTSDNLLAGTSSSQLTTTNLYDGENQRIAAIESGTRTDFALDEAAGNELVLTETTGSETTTLTYGLALISRETSQGIRYLLADALGSVRLETDASGQVVKEHTYEPFGAELGTPDLTGNRFRFTGEHTEASGLIFLRARVYDPETGTFLSVDPIPTVRSLYAYCGNNPLVFVDPSGMVGQGDFGTATGDLSPTEAQDLAWRWVAWCLVGAYDDEMHARLGSNYWPYQGLLFFLPWPGGKASASVHLWAGLRAGICEYVSKYGIRSYRDQQKVTRGYRGAIQAHHLIEVRFKDVLGQVADDMLSIVLTREQHARFTKAWRDAFPYGKTNYRKLTRRAVENAAREIYAEFPEILRALGL